jgi:hypothetical protein
MLFTVDQANRTLPLVRRIVEDVVRDHRRWQEKILELELTASSAAAAAGAKSAEAAAAAGAREAGGREAGGEQGTRDGGSADAERAAALERDAMSIARDIDAYERELEELGIVLKDRRLGLVDFPGEIDGRRVWLCWRLGEPSVQYWHDLDAGYAGRQPLPAAALK